MHGAVKINDGVERQQLESCKEAAELPFTLSSTGTRRHLHDHRLSDGDLCGLAYQLCESVIGRTSGRPVELDPSSGVHEDQVCDGP